MTPHPILPLLNPQTPLDLLTYPQIDPVVANELGAPITISEVKDAISSLQSNKSPDGFTTEFHKTYSATLAMILVKVFNDARVEGLLPPTMSEASITLLLKKDKDPLLFSSYRPIPLLNADFKILAKVLAGRLQRVISSLVNPDQTGFISGRHSSSNTRRLINILYSPSTDCPELVLSLDAEAFNHVEIPFLHSQ